MLRGMITIAGTSSEQSLEAVRRILREFNVRVRKELRSPDLSDKPLNLVAKSSGRIVGGLLATTRGLWLKVSIMAVDESQRRQGLGTRLLRQAEALARGRGCRYAYVDTMDYQAPGFYRRLGYRPAGKLINWDSNGHDKLFFTKLLRRRS